MKTATSIQTTAVLLAMCAFFFFKAADAAPLQMESFKAFIISTPTCDVYNVLQVNQGHSNAPPTLAFTGQAFDNYSSRFIIKKFLGSDRSVQLSIHWAAHPHFALTVQGSKVSLQDTAGNVGLSHLFQEVAGLGSLLALKSASAVPGSYIYGDLSGAMSLGRCKRSPYAQLRICLNERSCDF